MYSLEEPNSHWPSGLMLGSDLPRAGWVIVSCPYLAHADGLWGFSAKVPSRCELKAGLLPRGGRVMRASVRVLAYRQGVRHFLL